MIKYILVLSFVVLVSCNLSQVKNKTNTKNKSARVVDVPVFDADSAYYFVKGQVDFGPRVPNSKPHELCAAYLADKLRGYGADVIVQEAQVRAFDNTLLNAKNIIGQYKPEVKNRVLLFAHWDSRPFADHCEDVSRRNEAILGANDGASGVGVLLEIARQLNVKQLDYGVDIIFFDAEDYGIPDHIQTDYKPDTWCLGSQYWGKNPHRKDYYAKYGILLDMVGAKGATFYQELHSLQYAPRLVRKVWNTANKLGYGNYFVYQKGGAITDDHVYVNKYLNIPCIDIIQHDPSTSSSFGSYWHTHDDNMDVIDKATLKAVGQTLLEVLYNEK
ncbi:M28 family peptidase [Labilibacter sediminis]|nr:M28 family peptidase [Labilibacter sediminis]